MPDPREALRRRDDVRDEDIDDIIGLAAELQEQAARQAGRPTVADVERVAAELDIAPEHVQTAIDRLHDRRRDELAAREEALERSRHRATRIRYALLIAAAALAIAIAVVGAGLGVLGASGAASIRDAATLTDQAQARLDVVLERQATLAPQLLALSGGQDPALTTAAQVVRTADSAQTRLRAAEDLDAALSRALADLPAPADPSTAQQRLDLQHEVVGLTNRVTVERRRLASALAHEQATRTAPRGQIATWLRLAPEAR